MKCAKKLLILFYQDVPDWFVTNKMIEKLDDFVFSNDDDIVFGNTDSDNVK